MAALAAGLDAGRRDLPFIVVPDRRVVAGAATGIVPVFRVDWTQRVPGALLVHGSAGRRARVHGSSRSVRPSAELETNRSRAWPGSAADPGTLEPLDHCSSQFRL